MKKVLLFTFVLVNFSIISVSAQQFPTFLKGTWKLENKDTYEHWDLINANSLKGFSYKLTDGQMSVSEYLEINKTGSEIIYTATVINQNQGAGVDFKLIQSDTLYSFENEAHDFPTFIRYKMISDNKMKATIGNEKNSFTLIFKRIK